jgi:hypothetical protein
MEWLATPTGDRQPLRQGAFAKEIQVNEATLWRWRKLPGFMGEVNRLVDEHLADDYSEITDALKREARKGSIQHIRTYLEMIGKYVPRQEITGKDGGDIVVKLLRGVSLDDL